MNSSVVEVSTGVNEVSFTLTRPRTHGFPTTLSPIQRAKWKLAVLQELAEEGVILLSVVQRCDATFGFKVDSVSTAAAGFLVVPSEAVVWASLGEQLGVENESEQLSDLCAEVEATGKNALRIAAGCSEQRGSAVLVHIARTPTGLCLSLFCPEACERELNAFDALQVLLEAHNAQKGAQLVERKPNVPALLLPPMRTASERGLNWLACDDISCLTH